MSELSAQLLQGDPRALARLLTLVEREDAQVDQAMKSIYAGVGKAYCIGITGPPGSGKSTLVDKLTGIIRARGETVGIIAVDPTSPFSGGAVLGDRIRMQQHYLDKGVFIRSMATRGSLGGLPRVAGRAVRLLDAAGKDYILVETVGVGQTEIDIMGVADTVVVVLVPEAGDAVQTMKAGLMEIADIFVVNKADREGAPQMMKDLQAMLALDPKQTWWHVPVLSTQANQGIGVEQVFAAVEKHRLALAEHGMLEQRRQARRRSEFFQIVEERLNHRLHEIVERNGELAVFLDRVGKGDLDPYSAAQAVMSNRALVHSWLSTLEQ